MRKTDGTRVAREVANSSRWVVGDMRRAFRDTEFRGLLFFAGLLLIIGSCFYMVVEGWDVIEAFYFSVATLTTVGYGDLHPTTDFSRLFTALYALSGIGFILSLVMAAARLANKPIAERLNRKSRQIDESEN